MRPPLPRALIGGCPAHHAEHSTATSAALTLLSRTALLLPSSFNSGARCLCHMSAATFCPAEYNDCEYRNNVGGRIAPHTDTSLCGATYHYRPSLDQCTNSVTPGTPCWINLAFTELSDLEPLSNYASWLSGWCPGKPDYSGDSAYVPTGMCNLCTGVLF